MAPHVDGRGFGESRMTKKEEKNLLAKTPAPEPSSPRRAAGSRREATMRLPTWSESLETPRREGNRGARKRRGARFVFARRGEQPESNKVMSFFFFFFFRSLSLSKKKNVSLSLSFSHLHTSPRQMVKTEGTSRSHARSYFSYFSYLLLFSSRSLLTLSLFSLLRQLLSSKVSKISLSSFTTCPRSPGRTRTTQRR